MSDNANAIIERLIAERDAALERAERVHKALDSVSQSLLDAEIEVRRLKELWNRFQEGIITSEKMADAAKALEKPSYQRFTENQ